MTTTGDPRLDAAVEDAFRQVGGVRPADPHDCPPAVLERLLQHPDHLVRFGGLSLLARRVAPGGAPDADRREELTALVADFRPDTPETALALAGVYARLGPFPPGAGRFSWRAGTWPERIRVAWLRAELLTDPASLRAQEHGEPLRRAVRGTSIVEARSPVSLVNALADSGDPVLRGEAVRLAREGLRAGLLAPARVRALLAGLLDGAAQNPSGAAADRAVTGALDELAQPWAVPVPLPSAALTPFLTADAARERPSVAAAALRTAAAHGRTGTLRRVVHDLELPPRLRLRATELLGGLGCREDIGPLAALAERDPLLYGEALTTCLLGLHRRGHFPSDAHVPAVVAVALANRAIDPVDVATVLFTCRRALLRTLTDASTDDPGHPRRVALLVALAGQGPGGLPVGDALVRMLPRAAVPEPLLDAVRRLRPAHAEEAVIALLPSSPAAALEALEAVGGEATVRSLRAGLGLAPCPDDDPGEAPGAPGTIAPHLRAVRGRALEVLWHLTGEPARRRALLARLDPACLPDRIVADLGGPDEAELAVLRSRPDPADPVTALCRAAAHGGAATVPVVGDLLARIVAEAAAAWEAEPPAPGFRGGGTAGAPEVPEQVLRAVESLGRRLYARRKIRPVCLLDAADEEAAGRALLATTLLDLLERPGTPAEEQAVLLDALLGVPWAGTRARVHPLLRHRDPGVRKRAIALLAGDGREEDARALSATLIALTAAEDAPTARQAVLALGRAGARWAGPAVAACLGRPNMNLRKAAAQALERVGTPATVPALLDRLGRDDSPGLRALLVRALRAVLGEACTATVLAAAEHGPAGFAALLLEALDGSVTARSVLALEEQSSRLAPPLLALVAAGRVRLAEGTVAELGPAMARHGVALPQAAVPVPVPADASAADVRVLLAAGWDPRAALRLATGTAFPAPDRAARLRPLLPQWLRLAGTHPVARGRILRFALRLCPAPWSTGEREALARSTHVLLDALPEVSGGEQGDLLAVLDALAPDLPAIAAAAVTDAVRGLRPAAGHRSTLSLLRRLGAVPVRADLERSLSAARLGPDPWRAETGVLREAFAPKTVAREPVAPDSDPESAGPPGTAGPGPQQGAPAPWRAALETAVRAPGALAVFRRADGEAPDGFGSRARLDALIEVYASAAPECRPALVDWMTALRPLDAPPEERAEQAGAPVAPARRVHEDDLDQPRSAALRDRLLGMLAPGSSPGHARTAARSLRGWPEPEVRLAVVRAFLHGRVELPVDDALAEVLRETDVTELRAEGVRRDRVALLAARLEPPCPAPLVDLLISWWEHDRSAGPDAARALRAVPADLLAKRLGDRLEGGAWGFLDLLEGRPLLRTPELERVLRRLRDEGRDGLADRIRLVDGPLRDPDAARRDAQRWAAARARREPGGTPRTASRQESLDLARTGTPTQMRRALTRLAVASGGREDPELRRLVDELLRHPVTGVRLHAHRASRTALDRRTYLGHTEVLLDDPQPSVVRSAIRILCHARWAPAAPAVTGLLGHPHPVVREAAAAGLVRLGAAAIPPLRHAAARARPDRRSRYTDVLERITAAPA